MAGDAPPTRHGRVGGGAHARGLPRDSKGGAGHLAEVSVKKFVARGYWSVIFNFFWWTARCDDGVY